MKILYVVSHPDLDPTKNTGYGRHIRETIKGLEEKGHSITTCFAHRGQSEESNRGSGNKASDGYTIKALVPGIIWETLRDLSYLHINRKTKKRLAEMIQMDPPDIIYERSSYLSNAARIVAHRFSVPLMQEVNAPFSDQRVALSGKSLLVAYGKFLERKNYQRAAAIFTVTDALKQYIIASYGTRSDKIHVNHNGVDPRAFVPLSPDVLTWHKPKETIVIGFVGSIMKYHGVDQLIQAFHRCIEQLPKSQNVHLLIVGDGASIPSLQVKVEELGLTSEVTFTGSVSSDQVPGMIDQMDVCVLPATKWYCSPVKLFEYALRKKPIVVPDEPCIREIIEDETHGIIASSTSELATALVRLVREPELRERLGAAAYARVVQGYTWEANVERIELEIRKLLPA